MHSLRPRTAILLPQPPSPCCDRSLVLTTATVLRLKPSNLETHSRGHRLLDTASYTLQTEGARSLGPPYRTASRRSNMLNFMRTFYLGMLVIAAAQAAATVPREDSARRCPSIGFAAGHAPSLRPVVRKALCLAVRRTCTGVTMSGSGSGEGGGEEDWRSFRARLVAQEKVKPFHVDKPT